MSGIPALVTAADSRYFSLLRGLVRSVRDAVPERHLHLCVIDIGLSADQLKWVERNADEVAEGRWDLDFPERDRMARSLQGITCRPFIPAYFPGHEVYLWIDADAWVQEWSAVELLHRAAGDGSIGVVPQLDRAYAVHYDQGHDRRWTHRRYLEAFGKLAADVLHGRPLLNAGVFSMRRDCPGWDSWADLLDRGLRQTVRFVDQTALNVLVYAGDVSAHFLPSTANWMCLFAPPSLDTGSQKLVHPMLPHEPLVAVYSKVALLLGGSLPAVRLLPMIAGAAVVALTVLIRRELVGLLAGRLARFRVLGVTYIGLLALMIGLHAKSYYVAPVYPMLLAGGGVAVEAGVAR
jgi:hypothetical protein